MSEFNVDDILAEFRDGARKKVPTSDNAPAPKTTSKNIGATDIIKSISESQEKAVTSTAANDDDYDEYKPTEPLFSIEQLRKIEAQRKESFKNLSNNEKAEQPAKKETQDKPAPAVIKEEKPAPAVVKEEKPAPAVVKEKQTEKPKEAVPKKEKTPQQTKHKPATIFGDIEDVKKKPAREEVQVNINTNPFASFADTIKQNRFLFEELVKRDFKKKYKRTVLGMMWSVISPFLTFLVQLIIFGFLFRRGDSNFIIYLLTGNLMFHFFSDTTTTGMFSLYSNAGVLSKINVSKSIFLLSSNVAGIFNFLLTLLVYFVFMIFTGVNFGPHLILMIYPIVCMILFNIGISYILSALFVFFRDIQYLYSIATNLLMYISAIFYYADALPANMQIVFAINPVYRYIAYMRQLVIDSVIPDLTSHLICLGFAVGALSIGYIFHKKTEKNFVYYY